MRSLYVTFAAVTLFGTAAAFGQSQSSPSQSSPSQSRPSPGETTTDTTVPPQQAEVNPGGNDKPTKAMSATCKKMAADKKLTGDAKTQYIKDCEAGKKTREGH